MSDYQKEYIEFRLILLGDSKVGKKSFIDRLLNISSTSVIRNKELEHQYKILILKLRKKYEKHKKFLEDLQPMDKRAKRKEEILKRLNEKTSKSNKSISDNNTVDADSKITETKEFKKIEEETSFILKVTSDELYFSKKYIRPPIPEHPAKLFNIHKAKICIKPYYILPPEKIDYNYNPDIDDSDNELDTEFNVSLKGIKYDVKKIISNKRTIIEEEKLNGYKINVYNMFLFIYDISNYSSFEMITKYYTLLENAFNISKMENSIMYLIGNKKDKKILLDIDQVSNFSKFLKGKNFIFYEISTRSYYNFDKFFIEFILKALSQNHQELIKEDDFKTEFEKIAYNKPTFSRSNRELYEKKDIYLGPKYYANIYGFNSSKELSDTFNNEKMRFNRKIFCNKTGPKYAKSKSTKDMNININININNLSNNLMKLQPELFETKGGLLNKQIKGYQFGIVTGKLNLLKLRKKLISDRNESLKDSIEEGSSLFTQNVNKLKGDDYLEEAKIRRKKIYERKLREKKMQLEEIQKLHLINLQRLEKERKEKNEKILLSQSKTNRNFSFPDLSISPNIDNYNYTSNINTKDNEEEMNKTSPKNYNDIMHPKNKKNLEEYYLILKRIKATRKKESPSPGPNSYDIRNNLSDRNKGFTITGKRKEITQDIIDPSFPDLKDEFDIIASKALNNTNNKISYSPRFKKIEKEKDRGPYPNEKIWKRWEYNKNDIEKDKIRYFIEDLKEKKKNQIKKIELIKQQTEEIERLRREILIRKGYDDPNEIKFINYSQVETASPKYTLKGRHSPKKRNEQEETTLTQNINSDQDLMNYYIKNQEIFRPLPNANYVKPNLPSVVFGKAERFNPNKEYQGPVDLFPNGIFEIKTQENFSCKSPYDNPVQRSSIVYYKGKSPSPAEYKIKSGFEIIAEKGKKMSEIRDKIKIRDMLKNPKNSEKKYIKIHRLKKIKVKEEKNNENIPKNDNLDIPEGQENF